MKPKFFSSPAQFREWLEKNHDNATELLLGFHKKSCGKRRLRYLDSKKLIESSAQGVRMGTLEPKKAPATKRTKVTKNTRSVDDC